MWTTQGRCPHTHRPNNNRNQLQFDEFEKRPNGPEGSKPTWLQGRPTNPLHQLYAVPENHSHAAGFEKTVLLITSEAPHAGLFQRSSRANAMGADLFLSIHHDSVPDPMLEKWTYDGVEHTYNDRFPGHSIFISNDNPQSGRSLEFASLLGAQLKSRGLK
jgi:hypothetical protein